MFPNQVQGYTLVVSATNATCTGSDTVGPTLAGLITQSKGCLGVDRALYKDADNNQYTLVLFTMKDPMDAFTLVNRLAEDPTDFQAAVQAPPKDSGLRLLPADSGRVQSYAFSGSAMIVGMAQWSDGHSTDFNTLVGKLSPLVDVVIKRVPV
ncbi:hypothetical protein GCM10010440_22410 [Kitasatospora cinereorecta]